MVLQTKYISEIENPERKKSNYSKISFLEHIFLIPNGKSRIYKICVPKIF